MQVGPGLAVGEGVVLGGDGFGAFCIAVDGSPVHVFGFLVVVEELGAGVEVEVGQHVLFQVLGFDIATKGKVGMLEGGGVFSVEVVALQHTVVASGGKERVVIDEGGLAGEEREGYGPVGALVLEGESGGEVGGGEEAGDDFLGLVGTYAFVFKTFAELGLEVGREAGAPAAVGVPRDDAGEVDFVVAFAAGLEEGEFLAVVEVLPGVAVGQVSDVVPHIPGMGVLVVAEEGGGGVDL